MKSASGKTMMVERSKLERVMGEKGKKPQARVSQPLENQTSPLKRPNTRAAIKLIDDDFEEITLEEETEFGEKKGKVDLKRKAAEGDFLSRRLRRRG